MIEISNKSDLSLYNTIKKNFIFCSNDKFSKIQIFLSYGMVLEFISQFHIRQTKSNIISIFICSIR